MWDVRCGIADLKNQNYLLAVFCRLSSVVFSCVLVSSRRPSVPSSWFLVPSN